MNGVVINVDPVLMLGGLHISWYSLIVMLAILAGVGIGVYQGKKNGIPTDKMLSMAPWVVFGGLIGARLFHVIDHWQHYLASPLQIFAIWQGGLAIWGALAGGAVAALICARQGKIPFWRLADTMVPALLVAQIIGRFACIIDGDSVGGPTSLPWAFTYINPGAMVPPGLLGVPVHPYPVYDQLWNILGLAVALKLRRRLQTEGLLFATYLSIYAVGRLLLSFVRLENIWFWGLQEAQVVAIAILIASAAFMIYLSRKVRGKVNLSTGTSAQAV